MSDRRGRRSPAGRIEPTLSDDDVERRLGGGAGLRVMHVRPQRVDARGRLARDTVTVLGGALVAVLAWQLLGGGQAGLASASMTPPDDTGIVVGSFGAPPTLGPPVTLGPIANASIGLGATPTPVPFATLGPSTLTVVLAVTNDNGGNDAASDWTVSIGGGNPSVPSFAGSASGTKVTVDPGQGFTISTTPSTPGGYVESMTGNCTGPVPKGTSATCTISEDDVPVSLTVYVKINNTGGGTAKPGGVAVTVSGAAASPSKFSGSGTGTLVHLNANSAWNVTTSSLTNYVRSAAGFCTSGGTYEGRQVACTYTFTYKAPTPPPTAPPTPTPAPSASVACDPPVGLQVTCSATVANIQTGSEVWTMGYTGTVNSGGDGTTSITFTYDVAASPGTYGVTVTVTGLDGSTLTSSPADVSI